MNIMDRFFVILVLCLSTIVCLVTSENDAAADDVSLHDSDHMMQNLTGEISKG